MEELLNMLGNETRREILQLLSERPCYVSELSQVLNIGQKAIIEHLELMRSAGILDINFEKIEKGRPRKYYKISQDVILEIKISPSSFNVETLVPKLPEDFLEAFPNLKKITEEIEKATELEGGRKIRRLKEIHDELDMELQRVSDSRMVIEYLQKELREEAKKESIKESIKEEFKGFLY